MKKGIARHLLFVIAVALPLAASAMDSMTIGSTECGPGCIATIPITVLDTPGTPLGEEHIFGSNIQAIAYQIRYSPASAVSSIEVMRSGVLMGLSPMYDATRKFNDTISHLISINEGAQKVHGLTDPGGEISKLVVHLSPSAKPGTVVDFSFVPAVTMLSNDAGVITETTSQGNLQLASGKISILGPSGSPVISIAATDAAAAERRQDKGVFTISRIGSNAGRTTLKYVVTGTARNGHDFRRIAQSVVIPRGIAAKRITIRPVDDRIKEKTEKVVITLKRPIGYTLGNRRATIRIRDND